MKQILLVLLIVYISLSETLSFNVNYFEAKTFNVNIEQTINETPIQQIDINTDYYITLRGMFNGKQVGKTFTILDSYNKLLEYHFICEDDSSDIYSITLDLFDKLIILNNTNNIIEIYYLELLP